MQSESTPLNPIGASAAVPPPGVEAQPVVGSLMSQPATAQCPSPHGLTIEVGPQWGSGMFDCTDDWPSCCDAYWCMPCAMGYQYGLLETGRVHFSCTGCLLGYCIAPIAACDLRGKFRRRYGIDGNCCLDGLAGWLCTPCSVAQNYRESSLRGGWPGGVCMSRPPKAYRLLTVPMGQQQQNFQPQQQQQQPPQGYNNVVRNPQADYGVTRP